VEKMRIGWLDVLDFFRDYLGKIMFLIGLMLLIAGLLWFNMFGTVLSAASFFGGILFVVFGLFVQLGVFSVNFRSLNGVALILICTSIICFAFAIAALEFLNTRLVEVEPFYFRTRLLYLIAILESERPYLWVSGIFGLLGLASLIAGVVLKVYYILTS